MVSWFQKQECVPKDWKLEFDFFVSYLQIDDLAGIGKFSCIFLASITLLFSPVTLSCLWILESATIHPLIFP